MDRELIFDPATRRFLLQPLDLSPTGPGEVRVRVELAAPKHGTEAHLWQGSSLASKQWDPELRLFRSRRESLPIQPAPVGNMAVGTVEEVGPGVDRLGVGDRVYGYLRVATAQQVPAAAVQPLDGLTPEAAVCTDPAHVALVAVRDGQIRVGDWVAVSGLGAIGLMCVQIARVSGAERVLAIDPVAARRAVALELGADAAFDPREGDVAVAVKEVTQRRGVDVVLETSGNDRALHQAIRCVVQCGLVVAVGWSAGSGEGLELGEEFHLNRPTLIGSQAVWDNPDRDHPRWTEQRARAAAATLLRRGKITAQGILTPIVGLEEAPALLQTLLEHPAEVPAVKIGIRVAEP